MRFPPPRFLIPLQERGRNALLISGLYQRCDIGWYGDVGGIGGVNGVGRQDGGVSPAEGVDIIAGKIVSISSCCRDKAWGAGRGCHGGWKRLTGIKGSKILADLTGSALCRESVLIYQ